RTDKIQRWRKIALSASQQSGREKIPEINEPVNFEEFLENQNEYYHPPLHPLPSPASLREAGRAREGSKSGNSPSIPSPLAGEGKGEGEISARKNVIKNSLRRIIFSEEEKKQNLKKILNDFKGTAKITLLIGPEGGFSKDEVTSAIQKGFISVSLGPRILRTETAPITALSIIQYELGDMG
ncbi:MAG: RsmE family RNA methyltransferase, partial [Nitrospirota bacterium]